MFFWLVDETSDRDLVMAVAGIKSVSHLPVHPAVMFRVSRGAVIGSVSLPGPAAKLTAAVFQSVKALVCPADEQCMP
jgi:hypothetical protein